LKCEVIVLRKRRIWYVIGAVVILSVVLGFVFTVPLNTGQQKPATLAQNIQSLVTNGRAIDGVPPLSTPTPTPTPNASNANHLFSSASPWNVPIGSNVRLDPNSSGMVSQLASCCHVPTMFQFGMPIYTSTASDPVYTVRDNGNDSLFQANQPIHIPDTAAPSPGSDHWMFIYDKTKNAIFEMWNTQKNGNTWTTNTGDVYSPTGDGVHQTDGSLQSGNGDSYFGGVVTYADVARGFINHALSFATQYTASTWRYPMNASDGHGGGDLPMGARLQLDPSVDCQALPGASVGEKMVCRALETYGGYIRDSGGVTLSMYFEGEDLNDSSRNPPDGSPGNPGRSGGVFGSVGLHDSQDLPDIPWDKLRVLSSWNSFTALGPGALPPVAGVHANAVLDATYLGWLGLPTKREDEE
jgi:hypothetical protein